VVNLSTFNVLLPADYEFYFERVGLAKVRLEGGVWEGWGEAEFRAFASCAREWVMAGGEVEFRSSDAPVSVGSRASEAMRSAGFEVPGPGPAGPAPPGVFSLPPLPPPQPQGLADADVYVINLDRRPDRWELMSGRLALSGVSSSPTRVPATDGSLLDLANSPRLSRLFSLEGWRYGGAGGNPYQDHAYRTGVLGCAHSHFTTWGAIGSSAAARDEATGLRSGDRVSGPGSQIYLILEDDVELAGPFWEDRGNWGDLVGALRDNGQWDICFLGTLDERDMYGDLTIFSVGGIEVQRMSTEGRAHGAGAFAMLVRPRGARKLRELAERRSIMQAVDWFIFDAVASGEITAYKIKPMVAVSPEGDGRDSDNDQGYKHARTQMMKENRGGLRSFSFSDVPDSDASVNVRQTSFSLGKLGSSVWGSSISLASFLHSRR
jgi:GR25 family glycosyltransferase involved in LPS biosynthesis